MRSIRFSLRHKEVFLQQLRAILRAGVDADLSIMFPMISSLDEFLEAKSLVHQAINELAKEEASYHRHPKIGMMVELPAVLEIINELAQEADFFSIGTNDFIQYMLAVDRTNEKVADLYLPHHPSILRALKKIVQAANHYKKDISVCGDMAHSEKYIGYLLGIGLRKISVDPRYHPKIQRAINGINLKEAQKATHELLSQKRLSEINKMFMD
jgi:phosphotransferase system, enzyme I, PtsP